MKLTSSIFCCAALCKILCAPCLFSNDYRYRAEKGFVNLDSEKPTQAEAKRSDKRGLSSSKKGKNEDRLGSEYKRKFNDPSQYIAGEAALDTDLSQNTASPNAENQTESGISFPFIADEAPIAPQEPVFSVSEITLLYEHHQREPISIEELNQIEFEFCEKNNVLYAYKDSSGHSDSNCQNVQLSIDDINSDSHTTVLSASAIQYILEELLNAFYERNIHWVVMHIPEDEISSQGIDKRKHDDDELTILISVPVIKEVGVTYADPNGELKPRENSKLSKKICDELPLSVPDPSTGIPGDFINSNILNNYLHSLNRHPNRRVDLEIGPTDLPGEVGLDFIVTQKRPYYFYFNANNNVPKPINRWQESVGFIHTQMTGNDDIFKFNASTDSFDKFYSFSASYEAPLGRSLGNRWGISGSYSRFLSAEFALPQNLFIGTQGIANLEFISNIGQWDRLFLDLDANLQYRHIHNEGHFIFPSATKNFILPELGLKLIQLKRESKLIASLSVQSTISSLFWDVRKGLDNLGRTDLSPNWGIVQGGFYGSSYLESLFQKSDKVKHLAHEVVCIAQAQYACNQRLIPELEAILGGLYSIRGYPQSTVAGDNMYMGSFEYRFHVPGALDARPNACTKLFNKKFRWAPASPKGEVDWDLLFRAFYDVGEVTVNQRQHFEKNYLIMGAGVGIEFVLWSNVFIRGDWGRALKSANGISAGNNQYYFSSTIIF